MSAISKIPQNRPSRIAGPSKLPGRILRPTFTNRPQSFFASSVSSAKQHEKREINNFSCQKSTELEIVDPNRNFRQKSPKSNGLEEIPPPEFDENIDTKSKPRPAFVDCNGNKNNYKKALGDIGFANGDESSLVNTKVEIESSIASTERQTNPTSVNQDSSTGIAESESDCLSFRSIQPGYFLQKVSAIKNFHQKANAEKLNLISMPESQKQKPAPDTNAKKQINSLPLLSKMSGQDFAGKSRFGYKTEAPVLSEVTKSAPPIHSNVPRVGKHRPRMPKSASITDNIEITSEEKNTYASRAEKRKRQINAKNAQRRLEEKKKTSVTEHDLNGGSQENSNILSDSENTSANALSRRPYFSNQRKNYPRIAKPVARPKKLDSPASDGMPSTLKFDEAASQEREEFNSVTDFKNKHKMSVRQRKVESRKTSENRTPGVRSRAPLNSDSDANHSEIQSVTNEECEYISSYLSIDEGVNVNSTSAMSQYSRHGSETNDIIVEPSPWQAGNYTTEQKIGTSERRLIRSSVSSNGLDQATCLTETKVFFSTPEMEPLTTHETNECTREKISYSDSAYEITNFDEEQSENSVEKNGALRSFRFSATSEMTVFSAGSQSPEPNATVAVSLPGSASSVNNSTSKAKKRKTDSLLMSPLPSGTKNKQTDSPCSQHNKYSVDQHHDTVIRSSSLEREICFEDDPEDDGQPEDEENLSALNDLSSLQESALISDFPSLLDEEDSLNSTGNENEASLQTKYTHDVEDTNLVSERRVILSSGMQNSSTVQTNVINRLLGKGSNGTAEDILPLTHNIEPLKPYKISDCPCESHQPYKSVFPDPSDNRVISIEELRQEQKVFRMSLEKLYHILQEEQAEKTMYTGENEKLRQENNTLKNVVEELTQKLNDINLANKSPQVKETSVQTATPTKWYPPELRDKVQSAIKVASEEIKFLKALHNDFDRRTDGADETLRNALKLFQPEESTDT